eukprot:PITA_18396
MEWLVPKDLADITSFMGLAGYYRRFVEGFSRVAYPITSLQKKGKAFIWALNCQRSFDQLKHFLTTAPILSIVDPNKKYMVCMDASKEGVRGILMQEDRVVAYESRKLKEYEQKYSVKLEGEFLVEPLGILNQREITLRKRVITQVKLQWQHYGPEEAN